MLLKETSHHTVEYITPYEMSTMTPQALVISAWKNDLGIFILALQDVEWNAYLHPKQKQDWSHCIIDEALAYIRDTSRYDKNCGFLPNLDPPGPSMPLSDEGSYLCRKQLYFPFKQRQLIQFLWDVYHRTHHPNGALLTNDERLSSWKRVSLVERCELEEDPSLVPHPVLNVSFTLKYAKITVFSNFQILDQNVSNESTYGSLKPRILCHWANKNAIKDLVESHGNSSGHKDEPKDFPWPSKILTHNRYISSERSVPMSQTLD